MRLYLQDDVIWGQMPIFLLVDRIEVLDGGKDSMKYLFVSCGLLHCTCVFFNLRSPTFQYDLMSSPSLSLWYLINEFKYPASNLFRAKLA